MRPWSWTRRTSPLDDLPRLRQRTRSMSSNGSSGWMRGRCNITFTVEDPTSGRSPGPANELACHRGAPSSSTPATKAIKGSPTFCAPHASRKRTRRRRRSSSKPSQRRQAPAGRCNKEIRTARLREDQDGLDPRTRRMTSQFVTIRRIHENPAVGKADDPVPSATARTHRANRRRTESIGASGGNSTSRSDVAVLVEEQRACAESPDRVQIPGAARRRTFSPSVFIARKRVGPSPSAHGATRPLESIRTMCFLGATAASSAPAPTPDRLAAVTVPG